MPDPFFTAITLAQYGFQIVDMIFCKLQPYCIDNRGVPEGYRTTFYLRREAFTVKVKSKIILQQDEKERVVESRV